MKNFKILSVLLLVVFTSNAKSEMAIICEPKTVQEITPGAVSSGLRAADSNDESDLFYLDSEKKLYGYDIPSCTTHISHVVSTTEIEVKCKLGKQMVVATLNRYTGRYVKVLETHEQRKWLTIGECKTNGQLF